MKFVNVLKGKGKVGKQWPSKRSTECYHYTTSTANFDNVNMIIITRKLFLNLSVLQYNGETFS